MLNKILKAFLSNGLNDIDLLDLAEDTIKSLAIACLKTLAKSTKNNVDDRLVAELEKALE